jgi:hypothetical protein
VWQVELTGAGTLRSPRLHPVAVLVDFGTVPVNDVEEFFAKVQQVAAAKAKAVMVTNNSFDRGTLEFARAKGIGLLRVFSRDQLKWVLHRSPSSLHMSRSDNRERDI